MSNLREAAQQALEALKPPAGGRDLNQLALAAYDVEQMLRAALAEDAMQRLTDVQQEIEAALQSGGTAQTSIKLDHDTVIRLALEAGADMYSSDRVEFWVPRLERFAALVAAHEQEEVRRLYRENQFLKHDLYDCAKACEQIAAAEREECAKVAETAEPYQCADLIRSRT